MVTPRTQTCLLGVTMSELSCRVGAWQPNNDTLCFVPAQSNSVLTGFICRPFTDVNCLSNVYSAVPDFCCLLYILEPLVIFSKLSCTCSHHGHTIVYVTFETCFFPEVLSQPVGLIFLVPTRFSRLCRVWSRKPPRYFRCIAGCGSLMQTFDAGPGS